MKTSWNILICMWIGVIHGVEHGEFVLTSSPLRATDGELFILTCIFPKSVVNIAWLQNNTSKVVTQYGVNCSKRASTQWGDFVSRINVSCNDTAHSIAFRFNSTTDQGSAWQCGNIENDTSIYPRSNTYKIEVASPVMSTQTLSTTTRHINTTSDQDEVTASKAASTVMSSQAGYIETTSGTDKGKEASTDDSGPNSLYIVVAAVSGAVLLTVVIVGIVCIRRIRKAAHQQNDMKEERNVISTPVYQNSTSRDIMENELYETSRDVSPINEAENQEDDFMLSDAYAGVDMPAANTCTAREQVASGDVNLEDSKPDKNQVTQVQQVSDIYAEVKKPKKEK